MNTNTNPSNKTKGRSPARRALAILLTLLMAFGNIGLITGLFSPELTAQAASDSYTVRIHMNITEGSNSSSTSDAYAWMKYKGSNGTASTETQTSNQGHSGDLGSTGDRDWTFSLGAGNFPTQAHWRFKGKTILWVSYQMDYKDFCIQVQKADGTWVTVSNTESGSDVYDHNKDVYTQATAYPIMSSGTMSGDATVYTSGSTQKTYTLSNLEDQYGVTWVATGRTWSSSNTNATMNSGTVTFGNNSGVDYSTTVKCSFPDANSGTDGSLSKSVTVYTTHTLNLDLNGGSGTTSVTGYTNDTKSIPAPTRTGYTFAGWTKTAGNGTLSGNTTDGYSYKFANEGSATLKANWTINNYYLDLNGRIDGTNGGNISGAGTADVYVGGSQKANDVTDYYTQHPYGSSYEINDIKGSAEYHYIGVYSGSLTGTIPASNTAVVLEFAKHTWNSGTVTTQPTCTTAGVKTYTCTYTGCSATKTESVAALGHNESSTWTTNANQHWKVCTRCGAITTAKADHNFGAWSTDTATCTNGGSHSRTCSVCSYVQTESTGSLGHSYTAQTVKAEALKSAATCTSPAVYYYSCSRCGAVEGNANHTFTNGNAKGHDYTGAVRSNGNGADGTHSFLCKNGCGTYGGTVSHTWNAGVVTTAPTCYDTGVKTYTCTVAGCGATKTETLAKDLTNHKDQATGNAYPTEVRNASAATCTADGYTGDTYCTKCNTKLATGSVIAALGHTPEKIAAKDATCLAAGNHEYWKCTRCNKFFTSQACTTETTEAAQIIAKLDHNYTGAVKDNGDGTHSFKCVNGCNQYGNATGHTWDEGEVTTVPGCTTDGEKTFHCTVCPAERTEPVGQTGHAWGAWASISDTQHRRVCGNVASHTETEDHNIVNDPAEKYLKSEATCAAPAVYYKSCSVCGYQSQETFSYGTTDPANHADLQRTAAVAATCMADGNIEYWFCSGCNKYYSDAAAGNEITQLQTVVAKIPHNYTGAPNDAGNGHNYACVNDCNCGTYGVNGQEGVTEAHTYGAYQDNTATCLNGGMEDRYCSVCNHKDSRETNPLGHDFGEWEVTTPATCEAAGEETRSCSRCDVTETRPVTALGHRWNWAAATYTWTGVTQCTAHVVCLNDGSHTQDIVSSSVTYADTTEATCKVEGIRTYTAHFANENLSAQTKDVNLGLAPTNHKAALVKTAAKAPTCMAQGNNEYYYCPDCGKYFKDAAGTVETTVADETLAIVPTAHRLTKFTNAKAATCTETGLIDSWKCDYCDKIFSDDQGNTEITEAQTVVAIDAHNHPHALTEIPENVANCIEGGHNRYYQCPDCGKYFKDAAGQQDTTAEAETTAIDPTNHNGKIAAVEAVAATCTADGNILYYHCAACGNDYADLSGQTAITDNYTDDAVPGYKVRAHGHNFDYANAAYTWLNGNKQVRATAVCTYDGSHKISETVNTVEQTITEATCTAKGEAKYTATFTNAAQTIDGKAYTPAFTAQSVTAEVPMLAHTLVKHDAVTPTCVAGGNITYYECSVCLHKFKDNIGYQEIADGEELLPVDPDNHDMGAWQIREGDDDVHIRYCQRVGCTHSETTAHVWGEWVTDTEATCAAEGEKHRVCDVCGKTQNAVIAIDPDAHDYDDGTVTQAATCSETGVKTYVCSRDAGHTKTEVIPIDPEAHTWDAGTVTTPATCTAEGVKTFTCTHNASHKKTEAVAIDPDNHDLVKTDEVPATCTEAGTEAYWACARCGKLFSDANGENEISEPVAIPATGHSYGDWAVTTEPTCTEAGVETRVCANDASHKETREVAATGHTPAAAVEENRVEATCTEAGSYDSVVYCSKCDAELSRTANTIDALGHDLVHHEGKDATCTENGWAAYDTCSRCDYSTYAEIAALDHDWSEWEVTTAATCSAPGEKERECGRCHEKQTQVIDINKDAHDWSGAWEQTAAPTCTTTGTEVLTCKHNSDHKQTRTVAALGHDMTEVAAVPATCTEAGNVHYWHCGRCGKNYEDEAGTKALANVVAPATGHAYGEWEVIQAGDCVTPKIERRICANNPTHIETKQTDPSGHDLTKVAQVDATCTGTGKQEYYHCAICGNNYEDPNAATKIENLGTWGVIPATGHDWNAPTYAWADDNSTVTATRVCGNDSSHVETETVETTSAVTKDPTCTEKGQTTYTAVFEKDAFETQTKVVTNVDATGHTPGEAVTENRVEPGCTTVGGYDTVVYCSVCDAELSRDHTEIAATGHDLTKTDAVPSTCYIQGYDAYYTCANCNKLFKDNVGYTEIATREEVKRPLDPENHVDENGDSVWGAWVDNGSNEKHSRTCTKCDAVEYAIHVWGEEIVLTPAGCTTEGSKYHVCTVCNYNSDHHETETIPALGHKFPLTETAAVAATCTETGTKAYYTCEREGCGVHFEDSAGTKVIADLDAWKTVAALGHDWGAWEVTTAPGCETTGVETRTCNRCGEEETREVAAAGHKAAAAVEENRVDATCEEAGHYDSVVYCSVCTEELSRETVTIPAKGHKFPLTVHTGTAATCTEDGTKTYYTCSVCDKIFADSEGNTAISAEEFNTWVVIAKLNHDPNTAVRENEHDADCTNAGSYDEVVYCKRCNEELSRETKTVAALGHTFTKKVVSDDTQKSAATCTDPAVYYYTCARCEEAIAESDEFTFISGTPLGHTLVTIEAKAPTCVVAGNNRYYHCTRCDLYFSDENATQPTTVADQTIAIDENAHSWGAWEVTTPATCTQAGVETRVCALDDTHTETKAIEAKGHKFPLTAHAGTAATCTEDGAKAYYTCADCSAIFADSQGNTAIAAEDFDAWVVIAKLGHIENTPVRENEIDADCTTAGSYDEVVYCKRCNEELSRETKTVAALGHTFTKKVVNDDTLKSAATCTEPAVYYYTCARCEAAHANTDEFTFISGTPLGHTLVTIEAKAPTCVAAGNNRYYHCTRCGLYFSDENATQPTTAADQTIAIDENAHNWGAWTVTTPATCTEAGVETRVCALDDTHTETRAIEAKGHKPAAAVIENPVEPKCEEAGSYDSVVYCSVCTEELSRETVEVAATGHSFPLTEHEGEAATCTENGTKTYYTCDACGKIFADSRGNTVIAAEDFDAWVVIAKLNHDPNTAVTENAEAADCTHAGSYDEVIYCKRCGEEISRTHKTVAALGHDYTKQVVNDGTLKSAATCTAPAVYYYSCARCGEVAADDGFTFIVGTPLGHTLEEVPAKAATCAAAGNERYYVCTRENCGALFLDLNGTQATTLADVTIAIDENAHDWDEGEVTTAATCVAEGVKTYTCRNDGSHTYTETLPVDPEAHKVVDVEEHQDPTCTEAGYAGKQICELCGATLKEHETIPALGHVPVEIPDVEQTCTEKGSINGVKCDRCGEILTPAEELPKLGHRYGDWTTYNEEQHRRICANDESHVEYAAHEWDGGKASPAATCSSVGVKVYTCKVCGATKSETIPANGNHSWSAWVYDAATKTHSRHCTNEGCEAAESNVACSFHSTVTAYPASFTQEGTRTYVCDICGGKYEESFTATGMALGKESVTVKAGKDVTVTAYVLPGNAAAAAGEVTWSSKDESIATVDANGKITGVNPGTVVITATAIGITKTVAVTVTDDGTHSTYLKITADGMSTTQLSGKTIQLHATLMPANASVEDLEWYSTNSSVASVSKGGLVTYNAAGTATIYAKTADGYTKGSIVVTTTLDKTQVHNDDQTFTVIYTVGDCGYIINGETINHNLMVTYAAGSKVTFRLTKDYYVLINGVRQAKSADGTYTIERLDRNVTVTTVANENAGLTPDTPASPADGNNGSGSGSATGACKYCGNYHTGFIGAIVGFFHGIFYFFKTMFGR